MEQAIVEVVDLSRSFGNKTALDGVSFRATSGQVYGLVGSNGAGKTTLLKHLLGLLRATAGSVRVFGLDPVRDPVGVLGRVGYLSEERELPEWMRIDEEPAVERRDLVEQHHQHDAARQQTGDPHGVPAGTESAGERVVVWRDLDQEGAQHDHQEQVEDRSPAKP